ncbi:MAG: ATP-binding protein [Anaerolineaceae bacterium]|nr:ATP-binding protein [Anaerolineaceae bacterium]
MSLTKEGYRQRLVDEKISRYLRVFGAVCIEGPKWCGKTWTSLNHANSVSYVTEKSVLNLASVDPKYIFTKERPQLIDEWQIVPEIWDAVRHECDSDHDKGKFILTGSTSLKKKRGEQKVYHTGTGRITMLRMHPMSLYESGDSSGDASLLSMLNGQIKEGWVRKVELDEIARLIIRGGWPENINMADEDIGIIPESYIEAIVTKDMHERETKKRSPQKMRMLIRTLSRHESTVAGNKTLVKDIEDYESGNELIESRATVADYIGALESLFLISNQEAFSVHYRSSTRIGKSAKRHLVDPSLSCASLHLTVEKLLNDHETFGLMFEALVERDLRIYAEYLEGQLYHFRDNASGDEVDAIVEFKNGEYAAFEIKLSDGSIQDAIVSLKKFYKNVEKKPAYMCVIIGHLEAIIRDPESGIFIVPATSLKP